jgi:DNA-binding NtrC family response regulator
MKQEYVAASKTIVVVEDDDLLRSLMVDAVRALDFNVVDFATADDALIHVMLESDSVALVVADLTVPGQIDGVELAEMLYERYPLIPFILTTGYVELDRVFKGGVKFLPKPWALEELSQSILSLVSR